MRFLGFEGGTIKDGMMGEAYKWLVANEAECRSVAPEGTGDEPFTIQAWQYDPKADPAR